MKIKFLNCNKTMLISAISAIIFLMGGTVTAETSSQEPYEQEFPLGLDEEGFHVPEDNPMTREKIELGRFLYFDKRMSKNGKISCSTCHMPSLAFTDGQPVSAGIHQQQGGRSAPTSINRGFSKVQFWDGRAATLEEQSVGPLTNSIEHGFSDNDEVVARMNKIEGYRTLFKKAFGTDAITILHVGKAIATFQRTLISGNSPFDRFDWDGEAKAISEAAKRGKKLFFGKARCNLCHFGTNFSDEKFHNIGIGWGGETVDVGRYHVTHDQKDIGAFKTPTLREISKTGPYMHDGRFVTLKQVIDHYDGGGVKNPFQDNQIIKLGLTESEKQDLIEMLRTLNGEGWQHATSPISFPK